MARHANLFLALWFKYIVVSWGVFCTFHIWRVGALRPLLVLWRLKAGLALSKATVNSTQSARGSWKIFRITVIAMPKISVYTNQQNLIVLFDFSLPLISERWAQICRCVADITLTESQASPLVCTSLHRLNCWNDVDTGSQLLLHNTSERERERLLHEWPNLFYLVYTGFILTFGAHHLANCSATVSFGHVTKAAECVPEL